jgi:hypothetical protein
MKRLRGPGIEICVGKSTSPSGDDETDATMRDTWSLPKRLISHYSPFLEAACRRDFKERQENRIELPNDDATVFAFFVEWMYYGSDSLVPTSSPLDSSYDGICMDAKCWVLGDRLLCTEFKNHAMRRLYEFHTRTSFTRAVTASDLRYACENSTADSPLRRFYFDFVMTYFSFPDRLQGTIEEFDEILSDHGDIRSLLIQNFRLAPAERERERELVKEVQSYLE